MRDWSEARNEPPPSKILGSLPRARSLPQVLWRLSRTPSAKPTTSRRWPLRSHWRPEGVAGTLHLQSASATPVPRGTREGAAMPSIVRPPAASSGSSLRSSSLRGTNPPRSTPRFPLQIPARNPDPTVFPRSIAAGDIKAPCRIPAPWGAGITHNRVQRHRGSLPHPLRIPAPSAKPTSSRRWPLQSHEGLESGARTSPHRHAASLRRGAQGSRTTECSDVGVLFPNQCRIPAAGPAKDAIGQADLQSALATPVSLETGGSRRDTLSPSPKTHSTFSPQIVNFHLGRCHDRCPPDRGRGAGGGVRGGVLKPPTG